MTNKLLCISDTGIFLNIEARQNGCQFTNEIVKWVFVNENILISNKI